MAKAGNGKAANGRALFLDRKLKRVARQGLHYETVTIPLSEPDTAREAIETLGQILLEWLDVIGTASTSDAREIIPTVCMDLEGLVKATVAGVLSGTWERGVDGAEEFQERLQAAGQAMTLDAGEWGAESVLDGARTLFEAAKRGQAITLNECH